MSIRSQFRPNGGQFSARFVSDVIQPAGAGIPILGVAQVALDLVQRGVNPRSHGIVLVLLDELMGGLPFAGQSQFHRPKQIIV